ncbi:RloB domain-containing protein [Candidatus Woesearchaeota archaeon]|nr:RloB domain-containing protein [Candidatus Woesearchaeota archaeon]
MARERPTRLKKTNKLWIFCEGKTEKNYFLNLRAIERVRLKIIPKEAGVSRADQILNKAIEFYNKKFQINGDWFDKDRDMIACVFDKDDNNTKEVFEIIRSKSRGIKLVYSNPSFEYWILCHNGYYNSASYDQDQVYQLVKSKMKLDTKKDKILYEKTKSEIDNAKKHAKRIQKVHEEKNIELISRDSTPLTLIYQIIEIINDFR